MEHDSSRLGEERRRGTETGGSPHVRDRLTTLLRVCRFRSFNLHISYKQEIAFLKCVTVGKGVSVQFGIHPCGAFLDGSFIKEKTRTVFISSLLRARFPTRALPFPCVVFLNEFSPQFCDKTRSDFSFYR